MNSTVDWSGTPPPFQPLLGAVGGELDRTPQPLGSISAPFPYPGLIPFGPGDGSSPGNYYMVQDGTAPVQFRRRVCSGSRTFFPALCYQRITTALPTGAVIWLASGCELQLLSRAHLIVGSNNPRSAPPGRSRFASKGNPMATATATRDEWLLPMYGEWMEWELPRNTTYVAPTPHCFATVLPQTTLA